MIATASEHEIKKFQLLKDDVIITKDSEDPLDIAVPSLVIEPQEKLVCGYHLSLIRTTNKKVLGSYLFWALKDKAIASQLYRQATGITRWAIASRHIKNAIIPVPNIQEQKMISNYLFGVSSNIAKIKLMKFGSSKISKDDETSNQLKLLTLYQDSLIHECVTGKKQIYEGEYAEACTK